MLYIILRNCCACIIRTAVIILTRIALSASGRGDTGAPINAHLCTRGMAALCNKTLFVRNIPFSTTDSQLEAAFSQHGELKSCFTVKEKGIIGKQALHFI